MSTFLRRSIAFIPLLTCFISVHSQTTNSYTTAGTWTVPAGVTSITVTVWGGAGGTGGQDCGLGCTNAAAGPVGYISATFAVTPGNIVGYYPGGRGTNGANASTNTGGGAGGVDTYTPLNYNGGAGGNAGNTGTSGGGGGGGAASVVTIAGTVRAVAGGGGGGGGMANVASSGYDGVSTTSSNSGTTGGSGTQPTGDGGGGGGGGGGQFASAGGSTHVAGSERAGDGGFRGGNSITSASSTIANNFVTWTTAGRVDITFLATVPVTWLDFTVRAANQSAILNWSTSMEENTRDYLVERSSDGAEWKQVGSTPAAGNSDSKKEYSFTDPQPLSGISYYRIQQRDNDGRFSYSKVVTLNLAGPTTLLRIYPNPVTNGKLQVTLGKDSRVSMYNSTGTRVFEKEYPAGENSLDVSLLPAGNYIIKVGSESRQLVISR